MGEFKIGRESFSVPDEADAAVEKAIIAAKNFGDLRTLNKLRNKLGSKYGIKVNEDDDSYNDILDQVNDKFSSSVGIIKELESENKKLQEGSGSNNDEALKKENSDLKIQLKENNAEWEKKHNTEISTRDLKQREDTLYSQVLSKAQALGLQESEVDDFKDAFFRRFGITSKENGKMFFQDKDENLVQNGNEYADPSYMATKMKEMKPAAFIAQKGGLGSSGEGGFNGEQSGGGQQYSQEERMTTPGTDMIAAGGDEPFDQVPD